MKKTITFLTAMIMVLNLFTGLVFADSPSTPADKLFDILYSQTLSGSYEGKFSVETDETLEFIDKLVETDQTENGEPTFFDMYNPMDFKIFANSLANVSGTINADYAISENFDKIQMNAAFSLNKPISFNENLEIAADLGFQMYMDFDFSDISNPVYNLIIKSPMSPKYIYINYSELLKQTTEKFSDLSISNETMYTAFINYISDMVDAIKSSMKANSTITFANNVYTMKINDKGLKNIFFDISDSIMSSTDFLKLIMAENNDSSSVDELKTMIDSFKQISNKFTILGADGYTALYKVNNKGELVEIKESVDISTNVFDICNAFGQTLPDTYSSISREDWNIDITSNSDYKYTNIGKAPTITAPTLTNDNSFDFAKLMSDFNTPDSSEKREITNFYFYISGDKIERDGEFYIPARVFAENCNIGGDGILYNPESEMVTLIASNSDYILPFETLSFYTNGHSFIVNGEDFWIGAPTFEENGVTYIPLKALGIIDIDIYSITSTTFYDINTGKSDEYTSVYGYINK